MTNKPSIKMLSLWQPWASLCIWKNPDDNKAEKQIETRHWDTSYRGLVAIHATKPLVPEALFEIQNNPEIQSALMRHKAVDFGSVKRVTLTVGAILGVVTLEKIVQFECSSPDILSEFPPREESFGLYGFGRFGWIFTNPIEFKNPIECRGLQNLGTPKPEIIERIFEQMEASK